MGGINCFPSLICFRLYPFMNPAWRKSLFHFFYLLRIPVFFLSSLVLLGTFGYAILEHWSLFDSLYMTVITLSTVGYGEIHEMSTRTRSFTILLILGGVIFYGLAINFIFKVFVENNFRSIARTKEMEDKIKSLKDHYIIAGGGRMAIGLVHELVKGRVPFIIIEPNQDSITAQSDPDWLFLFKDAKEEDVLIEAGIERAKGLAAVLPDDASNLFVVLTARMLNQSLFIQTRITEESSRKKMIQAGANKVVSPFLEGGNQMARSFINPQMHELLEVFMGKANLEFELKSSIIDKNSYSCKKSIAQSDFRAKALLVVGVRRKGGEFIFSPRHDFVLLEGDEVLLLGSSSKQDKA